MVRPSQHMSYLTLGSGNGEGSEVHSVFSGAFIRQRPTSRQTGTKVTYDEKCGAESGTSECGKKRGSDLFDGGQKFVLRTQYGHEV